MSELYPTVSNEWQEESNREVNYVLYMRVSMDNDVTNQYVERINTHNQSLQENTFMDSGFDILVSEDQTMVTHKVNKVDFKIKCEMKTKDASGQWIPSAFYMYPRSSISKSKFRLANNVGIIDSGYRGNLMGMFDVIYSQENIICEKGTRLLQICTPTLEPFKIVLLESDSQLSNTQRGDGGFGSSGGTSA
jgi:dUTP pyrophosphatase